MKPLVSVVIPTYNRGPRIRDTIDSVLAQTLSPDAYELIIIDDGSTDDTADFIAHTYRDDKQVRLVRQENRGVAAARNRGLAEAYGEFIAFLDHDDRWLPEKLQAQLTAFEASPRAAVVYCLWQEVDERKVDERENASANESSVTEFPASGPPSGRVYDALVPRNFIVSMSVPLIRTEAAREVGGFDPETVPCDDWDLWLRLARKYEFICVPRLLVLYTLHESQQSNLLGDMREGMEKTLVKQWPYLLNRPRKLWSVLCLSSFLKTGLLYYVAKAELYEARRMAVLGVLLRVAFSYPLALLSPQWLYFLKRFVTNNRTPF